VIGGWQAARLLDDTLKVGAPTAQGSGWPAPQGPADIGYVGDPQAAFQYEFRNVALAGELGTLPAWLVPPASGAVDGPWAIFVHGIGGRRENGYRFLPTLHDAGYSVLMISYRNDSDAAPDPSGLYAFGLTEWRDLDVAVGYALDNGASSVVLVAESMGGGIVGQFLRQSTRDETMAAIVLDAPAVDFHAILLDQVGRMHFPLPSALASVALWFNGLATPVRLGDAVTVDEFADFPRPLFLSHGSTDRVVPIGSSDRLVSKRAGITTYLRTEADHIQSWKADPARYEQALRAFLSTLQPSN
jgi:pimeloyl-ACP methyl ester carboxylesterase